MTRDGGPVQIRGSSDGVKPLRNVVEYMPRTSPGEEMAWWFLRPWLAAVNVETTLWDAFQYVQDAEG